MANQKSDAFVLTQKANITLPTLPVECSFKIPAAQAKTILFLTLYYSHVTWCFQNMAEAKLVLYLVKNTRTRAQKPYYLEASCDARRKRWHCVIPESMFILPEYSAAKACNEKSPLTTVSGTGSSLWKSVHQKENLNFSVFCTRYRRYFSLFLLRKKYLGVQDPSSLSRW